MCGTVIRAGVAGCLALIALAGAAWSKPVSVTVLHPPPAVTGSSYNQVEVTATLVVGGAPRTETTRIQRFTTSKTGEGTVKFDLDPGTWSIAVTQNTSRNVEDARGRECRIEGRTFVKLSVGEEGTDTLTVFLGPEDFVSLPNECVAREKAQGLIRFEWNGWILREFDRKPTLAKSRELQALRQRINASTPAARDSAEESYIEAKAQTKAAAEPKESAPEEAPREAPRGEGLEGLPGFGGVPDDSDERAAMPANQTGLFTLYDSQSLRRGEFTVKPYYTGVGGLGTASNAGLNHPVTGANTGLLEGPVMLHGFGLDFEIRLPSRDADAESPLDLSLNRRFTNNWQLYGGASFAHASGSTQAYSPVGGQNKFFSFLFPKVGGCTLVNPCINYSLPANSTDLAVRIDHSVNIGRIAVETVFDSRFGYDTFADVRGREGDGHAGMRFRPGVEAGAMWIGQNVNSFVSSTVLPNFYSNTFVNLNDIHFYIMPTAEVVIPLTGLTIAPYRPPPVFRIKAGLGAALNSWQGSASQTNRCDPLNATCAVAYGTTEFTQNMNGSGLNAALIAELTAGLDLWISENSSLGVEGGVSYISSITQFNAPTPNSAPASFGRTSAFAAHGGLKFRLWF